MEFFVCVNFLHEELLIPLLHGLCVLKDLAIIFYLAVRYLVMMYMDFLDIRLEF